MGTSVKRAALESVPAPADVRPGQLRTWNEPDWRTRYREQVMLMLRLQEDGSWAFMDVETGDIDWDWDNIIKKLTHVVADTERLDEKP